MPRPTLSFALVTLSAALAAWGAPAQPAKPMPTKDFVVATAQADQFEIDEGQLATVQSRNAQVRAFARRMMDDHAMIAQAMRQAAVRSGMLPPPRA